MSSVKETANEVVSEIISEAESNMSSNLDDSLKLAVKKSEEAFSFLEHEEDVIPLKQDYDNNDLFINKETELYNQNYELINNVSNEKDKIETPTKKSKNKSNIPKLKSKEKYLKDEKDVDVVLSQTEEENLSLGESDILSRIPVASNKQMKVKTIKKHSKDPLKDFVKMVNADGNWDEMKLSDTNLYEQKTYTTTEPDGTTTTTKIEYSTSPEVTKTTTIEYSTNSPKTHKKTYELSESNNVSPKSKIPVLMNEVSKTSSPTESHKDIVDSDSDTDSRQSPPLKGILKKSSMRTLGSSSGSDIALHEAGGELSDDDTGNLKYFLSIVF